jgi:hypothetical protein
LRRLGPEFPQGREVTVIGRREIFVGVLGTLLLASAGATTFAQAPAPKAQPAAAAAAPPKFVTPVKGEAEIQILQPQSSLQGNIQVTKIKVKNLSKGPLIGFKAEEYWYSAKGETVSGSPVFRHPKPFMPNEVIEVVLRSPKHPEMNRSLRVFGHGNGKIKASQVAKFKADS